MALNLILQFIKFEVKVMNSREIFGIFGDIR